MNGDNVFLPLINIQISLNKLLNIVPNFKQHIIEKYKQSTNLVEYEVEVDAVQTYQTSLEEHRWKMFVFKVPTISRVCRSSTPMYFKLGSPKLVAVPFQVKMADQRRLHPMGILKRSNH